MVGSRTVQLVVYLQLLIISSAIKRCGRVLGYQQGGPDADCCPSNTNSVIPSFVGNDYYCESGYLSNYCNSVCTNDMLWDGQQCPGVEPPCCNLPNMPWFTKTLNETTTDDIELRACQSNEGAEGSVPIFLIELYVR